MTILLITVLMSLSMYTFLMTTPMSLGLVILFMAIITTMLFALINSTWMSFLIFLIYISGTLVMFSYFVAMTPNMNMMLPIHIPLMILMPIIITTILNMLHLEINMSLFTPTINTFYNKLPMSTLLILVMILLYTMIIVVKISSSNKGPLRPFNNYV